MYKTLVNNINSVELNNKIDFIINTNETVGIVKNANASFMVQVDGNQVLADLVSIDEDNKEVKVKIDQQLYTVNVQEPADLLLQKVGVSIVTEKKITNLKSAMPGLVLEILVAEGQAVKKGDVLLIVEAMKMENLFKASADLTIDKIKIAEKQIIEKGQELITFL
jgi:biotin carboxyl carrier protein